MLKRIVVMMLLAMAFVALADPTPEQFKDDPLKQGGVLLGMPDPAIIQADDGSFYIFATGRGLPIYHSDNLVDWKRVGRVFDGAVPKWAAERVPGTDGIWAPDIVKFNGVYFVYYCASTFGSQHSVIGVAKNKTLDINSPDYKWEDQGLVIESFPEKDNFNAIDPAAFQQADGRAFMVWGSYWTGIKSVELNPETGKILSEEPVISPVASRPANGGAVEGAYMVKNGEFYYLFVSFDSCCDGAESTYRVMVGRSKQPLGPYSDWNETPMTNGGGTLVVRNNDNWRGTGHNSVLTTDKGSWLVHHTYDTFNLDKQRILQIRPLYWTDSGWPVAGEPLSRSNPMATEPVDVNRGEIVGSWRISKDYGTEIIYDLLPKGRIANNRGASWSLEGNVITIRLKDIAAKCIVEPLGTSFIGRDLEGAVIRGKQLPH
jgi:arabinan endo-1,5-alpha-L-arabinosidase